MKGKMTKKKNSAVRDEAAAIQEDTGPIETVEKLSRQFKTVKTAADCQNSSSAMLDNRKPKFSQDKKIGGGSSTFG